MEILTRGSFTVAIGSVVHRLDKVNQKEQQRLEFMISDVIASRSSNQSVVRPPPPPPPPPPPAAAAAGRENSPSVQPV